MFRIALREFFNEEKENDKYGLKRSRRILRDKSNPLELPNTEFIQHYRVSKPVFEYLLEVLTQSLPVGKKAFAIPAIMKLAVCLHFFAEGAYQKGVARDRDIGMAQPTFSIVLSQVLDVFENKLCPKWITWPSKEEEVESSQNFYRRHKIPGVIGCVDGTHVAIIPPIASRHLYYNRKGYYSLNVMLVCDHKLRIMFVEASHPGACHDAVIWNTSGCREKLKNDYVMGNRNVWLLGDAGYPLEPWIITPYRNPQTGSTDIKFNDTHSRCRNIIERTNGVLKNRWRCLLTARQLHYYPKKAVKIVNVCVALHNICIKYKTIFHQPTNSNIVEIAEEPINLEQIENDRFLSVAQEIRKTISSNMSQQTNN